MIPGHGLRVDHLVLTCWECNSGLAFWGARGELLEWSAVQWWCCGRKLRGELWGFFSVHRSVEVYFGANMGAAKFFSYRLCQAVGQKV